MLDDVGLTRKTSATKHDLAVLHAAEVDGNALAMPKAPD